MKSYLVIKNNSKILDEVIKRYNNLNKNRHDIVIEGFDVDEMFRNRTINLSEFCYALGKLIIEVSPIFWSNKEEEELGNEIGYSTLGIIINVSNNKLHEIINFKEYLDNPDFIENLISNILNIFKELNNYFAKYLKHPNSNKNIYENKSITNFQILWLSPMKCA